MEKGQFVLVVAAMLVFIFTSTCEGIQCYQCKSFENSTCNDPFDIESAAVKALLKDCSAEATYCRKIDQDVYGDYATIRECGETETEMRCREKVGSKGVKMHYCMCDDKTGCNGTNQIKSTGLLLQALASIILAYFLRNAL